MSHGGARVGSGSKPKRFQPAVVDGGRADEVARSAPDDLTPEQASFWNAYAPQAMAAGTLTQQTVAAWRLLCEVDARRRKLLAQLEKEGETYIKAWVDASGQEHEELKKHPLSSEYRGLAKTTESLMGKFGLAPFGKPVAEKPSRRAAAANPWSRIMERRSG